MALDGFFINKLIEEINPQLLNNRLEKIEQFSNGIFVFTFYYQGSRSHLYFKLNAPGSGFFLGSKSSSDDFTKSNFLDSLRKNLEGAILKSFEQLNNDRVVIITFESVDFLLGKVNKTLIFEAMGRHNNLILLNDTIIIDAYHKKISADSRSIVPKATFEFFPTNKNLLTNTAIAIADDATFLSKNYIGVSPLLSKYLFETKASLEDVKVNPTKNLNNDKFYWFDLFETDTQKTYYNTLSELLESIATIPQTKHTRHFNFIASSIEKQQKKLAKINEDFERANDNLSFKNLGDAIYSSGKNLNANYSEITDYSGNIIKVDSTISLNDNAQIFYKAYQKAKRTINHLEKQKNDLKIMIDTLLQLQYELSLPDANLDVLEEQLVLLGFKVKKKPQKRQKTNNNITCYSYHDALFYVGKNNLQNEKITHTISKHSDYWFHVKDSPGSHVVLKGELNNANLEIAAMLAAKYSPLKTSPVISVNYTQVKNLKRIPGLPGYNVILKEYQTVHIRIDEELLNQLLLQTS